MQGFVALKLFVRGGGQVIVAMPEAEAKQLHDALAAGRPPRAVGGRNPEGHPFYGNFWLFRGDELQGFHTLDMASLSVQTVPAGSPAAPPSQWMAQPGQVRS